MLRFAGIVICESLFEIARDTDVGLIRMAPASEKVDIGKGAGHRLSFAESEEYRKTKW